MTGPDKAEPPPVHVAVDRYTVNAMPEDAVQHYLWLITVERRRGTDSWAVCRHRMCLGRDGEWSWEPSSSNRTDEWIAEHRFPLQEALALAVKAAPLLTVGRLTAAMALEEAEKWEKE